MSFILKSDPTIIRIKLTNKGRELLSRGKLTFKKFALGDSEINYAFNNEINFTGSLQKILRPKDQNPQIVSFLEQTVSGATLINLPTVVSNTNTITNTAPERGFFEFVSGNTYRISTNKIHVKQPDAAVDISGVTGGDVLNIVQAPTYSANVNEPVVGDYLLIKWANPLITGGTLNREVVEAVPYIWYKIEDIVSGTLAANNLVVNVDKPLPDFNGEGNTIQSAVYIYPNSNGRDVSGDSIQNYYGSPYITDFISEAVFAFLENYDIPTIDVPVWNMTIVFTEDVAGVKVTDRNYSQYWSKELGGFVYYIQQIDPHIKNIGLIHYTNNSPSNNYGEGLYIDTPILELPTIMWHKNTGGTIGLKLITDSVKKVLPGLDVEYRDLTDQFGNIVGKVFNDLHLFVIEDQELLFVMSYKSNRNWTLPEFKALLNGTFCPDSDLIITEVEII